MKNQKKTADKKTVAAAENKPQVAEVKTEARSTAKSAVKKTDAPKTDKPVKAKPIAKAAPKTAKTSRTTAAKKTADKATVKPAAKEAPVKTAAKAEPAPVRKGGRKPKPVTILTICEKVEKKIAKTKAAAIKEKIAVDIEVWGFKDGSNAMMYIEIADGKVTVSPHNYEAKDFRVSLSCANAVAFVDGKLSLKDLVASHDFYAEGNIAAALKLAAIF